MYKDFLGISIMMLLTDRNYYAEGTTNQFTAWCNNLPEKILITRYSHQEVLMLHLMDKFQAAHFYLEMLIILNSILHLNGIKDLFNSNRLGTLYAC